LHRRECFRYEYYPRTSWKLDIRLEDILPVGLKDSRPICLSGQRAGPPEDGLGAWQYLERLDNHKYSFPYEDFGLMARVVQQVLESGTREGLDLDELREAMRRVEDYQEFQPDHFDRREVNRELQAWAEEGERG
ncbi:MAG: IS1096 element passenger TnpR family protein, partial [Blastocatellia bacterium]